MTPPPFAAALLAGGRSRRMGTDKAFLPWAGGSLWEHQLEKLRTLGGPLLLSCRPEQAFPERQDVRRIHDTWPDCGPLGGVASCLRECGAPLLVVLGVDLPHLPMSMLRDLLTASQRDCGAVVKHGAFFEPLAAVYPVSLLPLAEDMLREGRLAMQEFIRCGIAAGMIQEMPAPAEAARWFTNCNTPGSLTPGGGGA